MDLVVNTYTALYIASKREVLPHKFYISLKGKVTALSDILRVGDIRVYLIELDNCLKLLIKDIHKEWMLDLEINKTCVFTHLRLATLEQGIIKPSAVYMIVPKSFFFEDNSDKVQPTDLKDLLPLLGIRNVAINEELSCQQSGEETHLFTFHGTVTCCDEASVGLYILDHTVRLFVGLSEYYQSKLRLHSHVSITNAHLIEQKNELTYICCAKTTIRFNMCNEGQDYEQKLDVGILENAGKLCGLNPSEVEKMLAIYNSLLNKHGKSKEHSEILAALIIKNNYKDLTNQMQPPNSVDSFLFHECCPMLQFSMKRSYVPEVLPLSSLSNEGSTSYMLASSQCLNGDYFKHWICIPEDMKMLIGCIMTSPAGHLLFSDGSHQLPLVLLLTNTDILNHTCSTNCKGAPSCGSYFKCPFISPEFLGKLICIQNFSVIFERRDYFSVRQSSETNESKNELTYLAFCLCDCVFIDSGKPGGCCKFLSAQEGKDRNKSQIDFLGYITEKHALNTRFFDHLVSTFDTVGYKLNDQNGIHVGQRKDQGKKLNDNDFILNPVLLTIGDSSLFPLVLPGQMYHFRLLLKPGCANPFETNYENNLLQKATKSSHAKLKIDATFNLSLQRCTETIPVSLSQLKNQKIYPLSKVLDESFSENVVSFKAIILSCLSDDQSFSKMRGLYSKRINLGEVPCLSRNNISSVVTTVYMEASLINYALGLIPGAIIQCNSLQRKVSAKKNVYFKFLMISSVEVIGFSTPSFKKSMPVHGGQPKELLMNLWQRGPGLCPESYQIECNICMLFRLTVKATCQACGSVLTFNRCRGCHNFQGYLVEVNAIVLVDDGTCQASVKMTNIESVRRLLTLTQEQWEDLVQVAKTEGQLITTKVSGNPVYSTEINWFLSKLTNSLVVLRPCRMVVKMFRTSPWERTVQDTNIKKFQVREEKIGQIVFTTVTPPLMQFECLDFQDLY